ncbi:uncharacterized protein LTR77_002731 [Saxophila tyrrhenica]|uniref:Uncharacterized protein n=1 Tax=Saxophila tyrrhenica TaxID=1690608 RepID=A0AAV9PFG8_9PEZI|nr:hypothetical protein LTR77_002731 [Saxophila tyrrhenica]
MADETTTELSKAELRDAARPNRCRMYATMDQEMVLKHRKSTAEACAEAEAVAHALLEQPELPLLHRARAYMVLGCAASGYLENACEAVRVVEMGIGLGGAGQAEYELLEQCKEVLPNAERDCGVYGDQADEVEDGEGDVEVAEALTTSPGAAEQPEQVEEQERPPTRP